jgi:hypothetical protein
MPLRRRRHFDHEILAADLPPQPARFVERAGVSKASSGDTSRLT